jgi:hypothetical protein
MDAVDYTNMNKISQYQITNLYMNDVYNFQDFQYELHSIGILKTSHRRYH